MFRAGDAFWGSVLICREVSAIPGTWLGVVNSQTTDFTIYKMRHDPANGWSHVGCLAKTVPRRVPSIDTSNAFPVAFHFKTTKNSKTSMQALWKCKDGGRIPSDADRTGGRCAHGFCHVNLTWRSASSLDLSWVIVHCVLETNGNLLIECDPCHTLAYRLGVTCR